MAPRHPTTVASVASLPDGTEVRLDGRVVSVDSEGIVLWDATGTLPVRGTSAPLGAWVSVEASVLGGRLTRVAFQVHSSPRRPFPSPDGDFQRLQSRGGLRARNLVRRARAHRAVREFFDGRDYLEVETPTVVPSPGLDVHLAAFEVRGGPVTGYLGTSPEYQMKRLLAGGLPRIYQIGRCYRRDEAGRNHEPEFTMVEWYRAFASADALMDETEALVRHVVRALNDGSSIVRRGGRSLDVGVTWERLTVDEAFRRYADVSMFDVLPDEERFYRLLIERIEPVLGQDRPVFLHRWPASMASLARLAPDDPRVAERFEAYVGGLELCNGFGELTDPIEQRARFEADRAAREELGLDVYPVDERFLAALEEGMPPAAGNALGFDRLVMLATSSESLEDVLAVPSSRL
ncbi:MAG: EF-P lysine aminoacylase EpmA [Polyangiales bacterium]